MSRFFSGMMDRVKRMVIGFRKNPPVFVSLIFVAVVYAIFHRTTQQFFDESLPIALFLTLISYGFFISRWSFFGRPKFNVQIPLLLILYLPILIACTTVIYWGIWIALRDSYAWLQYLSPPRGFFVALIAIFVIVIGYALFLFRRYARFFFGLTEAIIGLRVALHNVPANADPVLWSSDIFLVILTAGLFLVVRGFDNMHIGLKTEPRDAILKAIDESEYAVFWRSSRRHDE